MAPSLSAVDYTARELMVIAAAREIRDGDAVFVGMRLPLLAFALAKRTHAPTALGLFENGIVRETPSAEMLFTMSDPPNLPGATWSTGTANMMGLLAQGLVDLGFKRAIPWPSLFGTDERTGVEHRVHIGVGQPVVRGLQFGDRAPVVAF